MDIPKNLLYSKNHEWIRKLANGRLQIGITAPAQKKLGNIVYVEFPEIGSLVQAGEAFGSVESVKTVSELYAPMSGKVSAIHTDLQDSPEWVNQSPYEKGWMIEIQPTDADFTNLLDAETYQQMTKE